jgi:hypothetical protein
MQWRELKTDLLKYQYELDFPSVHGKTTVLLTIPVQNPPLTFTGLGYGSNKRVVAVDGDIWVLAMAGDAPTAVRDVIDEVTTLGLLAKRGIRVPAPFNEAVSPEDAIFKLKIHNLDSDATKEYPSFLQQFLSSLTYVEMVKKEGPPNFARNHIVTGGIVPKTIQTTIDDLLKIQDYFKTFGEWGDFQVMYNKTTGEIVVFDPMPKNTNTSLSFLGFVNKWLSDIDEAMKAEQSKKVQAPPLVRSGSSSSLPGLPAVSSASTGHGVSPPPLVKGGSVIKGQ